MGAGVPVGAGVAVGGGVQSGGVGLGVGVGPGVAVGQTTLKSALELYIGKNTSNVAFDGDADVFKKESVPVDPPVVAEYPFVKSSVSKVLLPLNPLSKTLVPAGPFQVILNETGIAWGFAGDGFVS